jgi:transcriptional regulator with XRE-family HTH domain
MAEPRGKLNTGALREARLGKGWTQHELSARTRELGDERLTADLISKYERGFRNPRRGRLEVIASALGKKPSDLLTKEAA